MAVRLAAQRRHRGHALLGQVRPPARGPKPFADQCGQGRRGPRRCRTSAGRVEPRLYKNPCPGRGPDHAKNVEPGAYVQVGQPLLALVQPDVWVIANFKETQLTHMRKGQPVVVQVDTYPGVNFAAHVDSIQQGSGAYFSLLPPENATGNYVKVVQRVPVKIVFDDPRQVAEHALGPGMSVVPIVNVRGGKKSD